MLTVDYLVVGHGLAGATLAHQFPAGSVAVIDPGVGETSSRVAAGLITPVTGKRLTADPRFPDLLATATAFYRRMEAETGTRFFYPRRTLRVFRDDAERELFARREWSAFRGLVATATPGIDEAAFAAPHGGFEMTDAGQLAVPAFIDASRALLETRGRFLTGRVDAATDFEVADESVTLPRFGVRARRVIFCEGFTGKANPYFPMVKFRPAVGEVLDLRIPGLAETRVVNRGVWLLPVGGDRYRAGATYRWDTANAVPTAAGRAEIEAGLRDVLKLPFEVTGHRAGVRPIAEGHGPVTARHPVHPALWYFNGLGSKGVLIAPATAERLAAACRLP